MCSMRDHYACECALETEQIVEVLVQFYNIITKDNHYPKRWPKVANVMLEKGKGYQLKKLKIFEMTEANLKLVMRIHLGTRMNERVESNARLSNINMDQEKDVR